MPATKLSKGSTMHAAGIYADMTVDGPEIGTLVVIVDRAKNLPNRKSMGKQDPYCNCRLAKEARKTKTDKRGGQVPKWDEELRFTVRDSPDYCQLKVSIFNDDKKTELIGESWVDLVDVISSGGGQSDTWHTLNCRGKYAGEVRLEMTYYDSRPKPEKPAEESIQDSVRDASGSLSGSRHQTPVKRRPLPSDPLSQHGSPADHGRPLPPAGGPREPGTPSRPLLQPHGRSVGHTPGSNRRTMHNNNQPQPVERRPVSQQPYYAETPDDPFTQEPHYQPHQEDSYSSFGGFEPYPPPPQSQHENYQYQDNPLTGLPELPPMTNHRRQSSHRPSQDPLRNEYSEPTPPRQPELHHTQSAPQVPVQAPYPEDMMHPRDTFQHTQSDGYLNHSLPARKEYDDTYQQLHDPYPPRSQEMDTSSGYQYTSQMQAVQPAPAHEGYDHIPSSSIYRRPSDQYERPTSSHYQLDAPPPPPAHRDSAPNSARRESYSNYAPAPLNITPLRRSPSPLPHQEPDPYSSLHQYNAPSEYGGRRNTAPTDGSPQEQHVYRPRAMSGEAMRELNRPVSHDEQYALPPSHPDYYSPITGTPPVFPDTRSIASQRRESYQPPYQPVQRSPLAVESPHSFRSDRSSLPSQQNTPSRGSDLYQQVLPARVHPTPPRPYSNHHYSSSEPYVPPTNYQTPPRQHPLSQQVPAGSPPNSYHQPTPPQDQVPIVRPIALPAQATPSSEPRQFRPVNRSTPTTRKSLSPQPPMSDQQRPSSTHFDPDSFNRFNPTAMSSSSSLANHPATSSHGSTPARESPYTKDGKIVDFHGNHIDPSDRLPETAWAPEPEPKGPVKDKPYRERERIGGARDLNVTLALRTSPRVSIGGNTPVDSPTTNGAGNGGVIRARLRKKERPTSAIVMSSAAHDRPFRDIPNPAGSPNDYSPPHWSSAINAIKSSPNSNDSPGGYGAGYGGNRYFGGNGNGPPPIPAKVPLNDDYAQPQDNVDALSAELSRIDIGAGNGRQRLGRGRLLGFRG